jgi:hypothetical protein
VVQELSHLAQPRGAAAALATNGSFARSDVRTSCMQTSPRRRHIMFRCRVCIAACWIGSVLQSNAQAEEFVPETIAPMTLKDATDEDWADLLRTLDVLETGSRDEKLRAIAQDDDRDAPFYWIDLPPANDERATAEVIERLRRYVLREDDLWVLDRVLASLGAEEIEEATPVFEAMLNHRAPSVRKRAIEFLAEDSSLEDEEIVQLIASRWSMERTAWVRAVLLKELEEYDSTVHDGQCLEMMWDPDLELASAAIDCVALESSAAGAAGLIRRSMTGAPLLRVAALKALTSQPREHLLPFLPTLEPRLLGTPVTPWLEPSLLAALKAAGSTLVLARARQQLWNEDTSVARAAIDVLEHKTDPADIALLTRRAREGPEALRVHALDALDWSVASPELDRLLRDSLGSEQPLSVRLRAIATFHTGSPIERFRQELQVLAFGDTNEVVREAARGLFEEPTNTMTAMCGCPVSGGTGLPMVVIGDESSTRCYAAPGIEASLERAVRLSVGSLVVANDRFDDGDSMWFSVSSDEDKPCWVPAAAVRQRQPDDSAQTPKSTPDFEMTIEATLDESFRALEEQRIVETFDRGTALVGVRLTVDPADDEALALLREADEWAATPLGDAVRAILPAVFERQGSSDGWDGWWLSTER